MDSLVDTSDMFNDEDLLAEPSAAPAAGKDQREAADLLADMSGLSARERAALKRKAKANAKRPAPAGEHSKSKKSKSSKVSISMRD